MKKLLFPRGALAIAALVTLATLVGCGPSYKCCNQRSYYDCASQAAATACETRSDYTDCTRNSGKDNSCQPL